MELITIQTVSLLRAINDGLFQIALKSLVWQGEDGLWRVNVYRIYCWCVSDRNGTRRWLRVAKNVRAAWPGFQRYNNNFLAEALQERYRTHN